MAALELPYEHYVEINGGEHCGICGRPPSNGRRLDRDHDHKSGMPRGLLCWACNRQLRTWATVEWLRAAADYLERVFMSKSTGRRPASDPFDQSKYPTIPSGIRTTTSRCSSRWAGWRTKQRKAPVTVRHTGDRG